MRPEARVPLGELCSGGRTGLQRPRLLFSAAVHKVYFDWWGLLNWGRLFLPTSSHCGCTSPLGRPKLEGLWFPKPPPLSSGHSLRLSSLSGGRGSVGLGTRAIPLPTEPFRTTLCPMTKGKRGPQRPQAAGWFVIFQHERCLQEGLLAPVSHLMVPHG